MSRTKQFLESLPALGMAAGGSFAKTILGMGALAMGLAVVAFAIVFRGVVWHGAIAAMLALLVTMVLGLVLAFQRGAARAIMKGIEQHALASQAVGLVFGKLLGLADDAPEGERGNAAAQAIERLPLGEAESRLRSAMDTARREIDDGAVSGWLATRVHTRLIGVVEQITLARFRTADATKGIDLLQVRDALAEELERQVRRQIKGAVQRATLGLLLASVALSVGIAVAVRYGFSG
jgi:hypothetical protein